MLKKNTPTRNHGRVRGSSISTTGGIVLTADEIEATRDNRAEKKLEKELKKHEKEIKAKRDQLAGIKFRQERRSRSLSPSPLSSLALSPPSSTLALLPPDMSQSNEQPFQFPANSSPPETFSPGDLIAFGFPYKTSIPQWKIGKIYSASEDALMVVVATTNSKNNYYLYTFGDGQQISIPKASVVSSVQLNNNGKINLRSKTCQFLSTLKLVTKE